MTIKEYTGTGQICKESIPKQAFSPKHRLLSDEIVEREPKNTFPLEAEKSKAPGRELCSMRFTVFC
jgi:hypothetical protein